MGTGQSGNSVDGDDEGLQDDVFPWFHIIQWCAEDAPANCVFRWDLATIQESVGALVMDAETFIATCTEQMPPNSGFTMDDDTCFAEWAGALLEWSPRLRRTRFLLVPKKMKEDIFWSRFFGTLRVVVREKIFAPAEPESEDEEKGSEDKKLSQVAVSTSASSSPRRPLATTGAPTTKSTTTSGSITAAVIATQDSTMSQAILEAYDMNPKFLQLAVRLSKEIAARDAEDSEKLEKGVQLAVDKGVLSADVDLELEDVIKVRVSTKSADEVADEIIGHLGGAASEGCIVLLHGLSGTGKGTTVAKLQDKLPNAVTWSNGNIFRSLTLLVQLYCTQNSVGIEEALRPSTLAKFCGMLEFDRFNDKFDVIGLGCQIFCRRH